MKPHELPAEALAELERVQQLEERARKAIAGFEKQLAEIKAAAAAEHAKLDEKRLVLEALKAHKGAAAEFIADAWAEYEDAITRAAADQLRIKSRSAPKGAEALRERGKEIRRLRREAKLNEWIVRLYEHHFPWIAELRDLEEEAAYLAGEPAEDDQAPADDPVGHWVTADEYARMSETDRNQLALERYIQSRKSPWQLGRDYERYIGYLREQDGCAVTYQGIFEGLDDLGRDLVCRHPDGHLEVVQCKRWSQHKTIHEKHVFQLFGTVVAARIEYPGEAVTGTFTTTTGLSERAREFARQLEIRIEDGVPLADYPRIKCNIARSGGERIYHLPFDQQYDMAVIEPDRDEFYAWTAHEAEKAGFRRAWRWHGAKR